MVEPVHLQQVQNRACTARFRVHAPDHHSVHPRLDNSAGAHLARLQRHIHGAALQAPVPHLPACLPDCRDLRVGQRVFVRVPPVVPAAQDLPVIHDHAAYGRFIQGVGLFCLLNCFFHIFFIYNLHFYTPLFIQMYTSFLIPDVTLFKSVTSGIKIVSIVSPSHWPAPVSEIFVPILFILTQLHRLFIDPEKPWKTKGFRSLRLSRMIDAGNPQKPLVFFLHQQEMMITVIPVQEETVISQTPLASLQLGNIPAPYLHAADIPVLILLPCVRYLLAVCENTGLFPGFFRGILLRPGGILLQQLRQIRFRLIFPQSHLLHRHRHVIPHGGKPPASAIFKDNPFNTGIQTDPARILRRKCQPVIDSRVHIFDIPLPDPDALPLFHIENVDLQLSVSGQVQALSMDMDNSGCIRLLHFHEAHVPDPPAVLIFIQIANKLFQTSTSILCLVITIYSLRR